MYIKKRCVLGQTEIVSWTCKIKTRQTTSKDKILSGRQSPNIKHSANRRTIGKIMLSFGTDQTFPKVVRPHSGNQT